MRILYFFTALLIICAKAIGQTPEEVKSYFNKTNIAIYKCQKELLNKPNPTLDADLRNVILSQLNARSLYVKNDIGQSLKYTAATRNKCIELFAKLNVANYSFFVETDEEKKITKGLDLNFTKNNNALTLDQVKEVSLLDLKNPQAVYSTIPNIN